jgi:hypothetical protein
VSARCGLKQAPIDAGVACGGSIAAFPAPATIGDDLTVPGDRRCIEDNHATSASAPATGGIRAAAFATLSSGEDVTADIDVIPSDEHHCTSTVSLQPLLGSLPVLSRTTSA